jgi:regulator of replication initiation timing
MNITIERLFQKIGNLHVSQDLLIEENVALREAAKVRDAIKAEIAKLESEGETVVTNVLDRLKKLL